jgi:hypothetical protein
VAHIRRGSALLSYILIIYYLVFFFSLKEKHVSVRVNTPSPSRKLSAELNPEAVDEQVSSISNSSK